MGRLAAAVFATVTLGATVARADAVPPPPEDCKPGTVGVTDHAGPRCELDAPKNCPPGWRGVVGGDCAVALCDPQGSACEDGQRCVPQSVCHEPRERWIDYGRGPAPRGPELAGPPRQLDEPVTDWLPVGLCSEQRTCDSPSECRPAHVCVPPGARPEPGPRSPPAEPTKRGCAGCSAPRGELGRAAAAALLAAGIAIALRRRRER
jgi:hypothetical protein